MNKNRSVIIATILLILFIVISIGLITRYVDNERKRDMFKWQDRLSILAETQKRAIEDWLNDQIVNLNELAENPLMQIFLTMDMSADQQTEVQQGQIGHLRNLVVATARRAEVFSREQTVISNQADSGHDGIGVIDASSKLLMSTRNFPQVGEHIRQAINLTKVSGRAAVYGIYSNVNNEPRLIIVVPVSAIQTGINENNYAGFIVAVINPEHSLYQMVAQHWLTTATDEAVLVSGDEVSTVYLSPLRAGRQLFHQVAASSDHLAANFARMKTGGFDLRQDYRGVDVLVTGRSIDRTNWVLMQTIDVSEALRESKSHQGFILTVFLLAVFIITVSFIAIWRHSTTIRLEKATARLAARTALLNSVGDNIRDHIFLLGADENIIFINKTLSDCIGIHYEEIIGKSLHHIFSIETTERLLGLKRIGDGTEIKNKVMKLSIADSDHIYHVSLVSLMQGDYKDSLLYVLHDITELKEAQDRHNRLLEGIISTLVHAMDMHDPHCANHSERTREVAVSVAQAMGLDEERIDTLSMAALLANIGKLYLPREILTKLEPLTEEEEQLLQQHITHSADILRDLEFDGPVIKVIEQKNERPDGKGYPAGLSADEIMLEASIIAVANAFVAMSCSRAYREGLPINDVLDALLSQADVAFDRNVIAALFHVAENRSDWKNWQSINVSD